MRGPSRASYAELRDQLGAVAVDSATAEQIGDQLFAVVRLLDSEHGLRRALADSGKPAAEKSDVARRLLHGRVSEATEGLVADAAAAHWATSGDFADALEQLAIEALTMSAQYGGTLDDLEDDLFRFARVVSAQTELRAALIGPTTPDAKTSLLANLLSDKVSGPSLSLMNVVHDPAVIGGVSVQIGDELIDGTAASRLAEVRRKLAG
jgi:F-type H+-transporting ATPase subunit delta